MFPELTTNRFLLTRVLPGDIEFLFKGLSDPVTMPFNGVYYETLESTNAQLEWYDKNYNEGTGVSWKIMDKKNSEKIGVVTFYYFKPEHKKAEVGFWLLPEFWNRGITTEVLKAVAGYCHSEKKIHRLEAFVEDENIASKRVLEKAGFTYEGTMKECEIKFGKYISLAIYALIMTEEE